MSSPITSITGIPNLMPPAAGGAAATGKPGEFQSLLESAVQNVDQFRTSAREAVDRLLAGEEEDLHTVALATQRAELAFDFGLQVRNKVVDAYQEIMRMQI